MRFERLYEIIGGKWVPMKSSRSNSTIILMQPITSPLPSLIYVNQPVLVRLMMKSCHLRMPGLIGYTHR